MTPRIGYDDPTVADDVEAAYDADRDRDFRLLANHQKWVRRGAIVGRLLVVLAYAVLAAAIVNVVHVAAVCVSWVWGWWG